MTVILMPAMFAIFLTIDYLRKGEEAAETAEARLEALPLHFRVRCRPSWSHSLKDCCLRVRLQRASVYLIKASRCSLLPRWLACVAPARAPRHTASE